MARLEINNFLSISEANIDLKRFTVFIGPQAQGKSVILKIIHFFEITLSEGVPDLISDSIKLAAFLKNATERFERYFPKYAWGVSAFSLTYIEGDFSASVVRAGGRKNNPASFKINSMLEQALKLNGLSFKAMQSDPSISRRTLTRDRQLLRELLQSAGAVANFISEPIFIPASRSFFANIEKNIFTLLSSRLDVDSLIAEFGRLLENTRDGMLLFDSPSSKSKQRKRKPELRRSSWAHIINGEYLYDGEDEFIESGGRRVRMAHSSSGQQEAIPLLVILDYFSDIENYSYGRLMPKNGATFFVEEPEAHLFPRAQKAIASILTESMNRHPTNRVIFTTHSPYMLTAVNNLHLAGKLFPKLTPADQRILGKIAAPEQYIAEGELAAYKVDGGAVGKIIDRESGLVNGMLIDEVSTEFAEDFEKLLSLSAKVNGTQSNV
jgi:hypothetical protein